MQLDSKNAIALACELAALGIFVTQLRKLLRPRDRQKTSDQEVIVNESKKQGVPKEFQKVDLNESKWTNPPFTLGLFQKILMRVQNLDVRKHILHDLNAIAAAKAENAVQEPLIDGEPVGYVRNRLGFTIFREVTGQPYGYPRYAEFVKMKDIVNRSFLNLIYKGIWTYEEASPEAREKFNKAVMPRVKKGNVVAPNIAQQQNVR